jgi:hypothetical protein
VEEESQAQPCSKELDYFIVSVVEFIQQALVSSSIPADAGQTWEAASVNTGWRYQNQIPARGMLAPNANFKRFCSVEGARYVKYDRELE